MKKKIIGLMLTLALFCAAVPASFSAAAYGKGENMEKSSMQSKTATEYSDILGVTHAGGYYAFDPSVSYIEEGAKRIADMGSKNIKLWLSAGSFDKNYPYNTDTSGLSLNTMVDLLKTPYYQNVLDMDFSTYIFEAMEFDGRDGAKQININDGMTDEEIGITENLMYETAKYLMTTYVGSDKKFVLQNWEGDNYVEVNKYAAYNYNGKEYYFTPNSSKPNNGKPQTDGERTDEDKKVRLHLDGMTRWINARQQGVDKARQEFGSLGVEVLHAFEVNFIPVANDSYIQNQWPLLIDTVVPYTDCDLYSYSCWSAKTVAEAATMTARLTKYNDAIGDNYITRGLDYLNGGASEGARHTRRKVDGTRIMLGEFGSQETLGTENGNLTSVLDERTNRLQRLINQVQIEQAMDFGVKYIMYWEMYCNELREGVSVDVAGGGMAEKNSDSVGLYLIRPDGTYNDTYFYLKSLLMPEKTLSVDTELFAADAEKSAIYNFNDSARSVEVKVKIASSATLENAKEKRAMFNGKIEFYGSADGTAYNKIAVDAFVSVQKSGAAQLIFVNAQPIAENVRYIKVKDTSAAADGLEVERVKVYRADNSKLSKLKISGTHLVNGEEVTEQASKFTLGSGEFMQINAEMTDENWNGSITFKSSNRYIATVDAKGKVQGRINGSCFVTVVATGGGLPDPIIMNVEISVRVVGELLLSEGFDGYNTIGYNDNETKKEGDEKEGFGEHVISNGSMQKFYKTENMQFYTTDKKWLSDAAGDGTFAYILNWNDNNRASVTYELESDIGGFEVKLINYEGGTLDRINVYVSSDDETYTKINTYITDNAYLDQKWYAVTVANRQIIPAGMRYVKFEVRYNDVNKWNPQMLSLNLYGESEIPVEFVDSVAPTLEVGGTYEKTYLQGTQLSLFGAVYADNFATDEELVYTRRVFLDLSGAEVEQTVTDGKVSLLAVGKYIIEYKVVDLGGNERTERIEISAIEKQDNVGIGTGAIIGIICGAAAVLAGAAVVITLVLKKRKKA